MAELHAIQCEARPAASWSRLPMLARFARSLRLRFFLLCLRTGKLSAASAFLSARAPPRASLRDPFRLPKSLTSAIKVSCGHISHLEVQGHPLSSDECNRLPRGAYPSAGFASSAVRRTPRAPSLAELSQRARGRATAGGPSVAARRLRRVRPAEARRSRRTAGRKTLGGGTGCAFVRGEGVGGLRGSGPGAPRRGPRGSASAVSSAALSESPRRSLRF